MHLAYMELRLATAAFFRVFPRARVHASMTDADIALENYTLIAPQGNKCLIQV